MQTRPVRYMPCHVMSHQPPQSVQMWFSGLSSIKIINQKQGINTGKCFPKSNSNAAAKKASNHDHIGRERKEMYRRILGYSSRVVRRQ